MSIIKSYYGSNGQAITVTLASLTNGSARASTVVDNTTNLFLDALVFLNVKTGASGTGATGHVDIYTYGTVDGGTNYTENASGSDSSITLVSPSNARLIGIVNAVANAVTYKGGPFSVAAAFGGVLPDHWGLIIVNSSGGTLDGTEASHLKVYQGIQNQVV